MRFFQSEVSFSFLHALEVVIWVGNSNNHWIAAGKVALWRRFSILCLKFVLLGSVELIDFLGRAMPK